MQGREYAITQAICRHAIYAVVDLPKDHPQRPLLRHQIDRLRLWLLAQGQRAEAAKIANLLEWWDNGATPDLTRVVLSDAQS